MLHKVCNVHAKGAAASSVYYQSSSLSHLVGPLPNTLTDIWRLVWQEKVKVIVMLTRIVEGGQRKCEQYWPDQEPQEYGPFTITLADQQVFADYTIRMLQVKVNLIIYLLAILFAPHLMIL